MAQSSLKGSSFHFENPDNFALLRDILIAAEYKDERILERLRTKEFPALRGNDLPLLLRRTSEGTPLDTLIRLFLMEVPVDLESARRAVQPLKMEALVEADLVDIDGTRVSANIKLLPYRNFMLAFDQKRKLQSPSKYDYVMGIGKSTITLENLTVRRQIGSALDLGSGCGIHALLAATHSSQVAAVDRNTRAVKLAAFNAKLNGISHIEFFEGDFFQPANDRKFDLIVSNPPFVISPKLLYIYRDGGMERDEVCRKIVREAPDYLNEGGYCQFLCNWVEPSEGSWADHLKHWFDGTNCDAWVMRSETQDAETYASTWIRHTELGDTENFDRLFEEWMSYYQEQGIKYIGAGLITMRRSSGRKNWFRADDSAKYMLGPCGDFVERGFQLRDFLETVEDDASLLGASFSISPDVRLERQYSPSSGEWAEIKSQLTFARGLAYSGSVDDYVAKLLIGCNGRSRLIDLLNDMAKSLGIDPATIIPTFSEIARRLIERGFLLPVLTDS